MTLGVGLIKQGFKPYNPSTDEGDFVCQDDGDGRGPYIREWKTETPCPMPEKMSEPADEAFAMKKAEAIEAEAKRG